jgi:hypothetical protein
MYLFIAIIVFIIIQQYLDNTNTPRKQVSFSNNVNYFDNLINQPPEIKELPPAFPWSKIISDSSKEYSLHFHSKIEIPSLNAFESWKTIIPNLEFNPTTKELIIPSKDEPSALAILNLIIMNFNNEISIEDILNKQLIQISITQSQSSLEVAETIRNQIKNHLTIKPKPTPPQPETKSSTDPVKVEIKSNDTNPLMDIKSDCFKDTFQHFDTPKQNKTSEFEAYDGNDYTFI